MQIGHFNTRASTYNLQCLDIIRLYFTESRVLHERESLEINHGAPFAINYQRNLLGLNDWCLVGTVLTGLLQAELALIDLLVPLTLLSIPLLLPDEMGTHRDSPYVFASKQFKTELNFLACFL